MMFRKRYLSHAVVGQIYRICYGKNNSNGPLFRTGRVIAVLDTEKNPLLLKSIRNNRIERSRYLITMREASGVIGNFYAEPVASDAKRVTLIGRIFYWFRGVKFTN